MNGYTTIDIDGKTIGLKFGLPALRMLSEKAASTRDIFGKIVDNDGELVDFFNELGLAYILYSGYVNNCLVKEIKGEHDFEFFSDYVESVANDVELAKPLAAAIEVWAKSREVQRVKTEKSESKKKTGQPTTSNPIVTDALA